MAPPIVTKLRARTDHRHPSPWKEDGNDLFEAGAGLAFKDAFLLIPGQKIIQPVPDRYIFIIVDCLIAIASSQPPRNEWALLDFSFQISSILGSRGMTQLPDNCPTLLTSLSVRISCEIS